jgi:hypothetical protein
VDDEIFEIVDEDLFDSDRLDQVVAVVWWLVHLLGGKVTFPMDEQFWIEAFPEDTRLVLRKEDGKLVLCAEKLDWKV